MNNIKVCKFGGTSVATSAALSTVIKIIKQDENRKYVVVSAPGKRYDGDIKVTDLLFRCYNDLVKFGDCNAAFLPIAERYRQIAVGHLQSSEIETILQETKDSIYKNVDNQAFVISRGEFIMAKILAKCLEYEFVDSKTLIRFDGMDNLNQAFTNDKIQAGLKNIPRAVIPGFYGMNSIDKIVIFSRGGGDVTGSLIAKGVKADVYENWTDVDGFLVADPKIVKNPRIIKSLTYREIRELSYMGATVIHPDAMFPVRSANIPINIRNVFNVDNGGTMIVPNEFYHLDPSEIVTGIAGKKGFSVIYIEKAMINLEVGFIRRVLSVLEHFGVIVEHIPSSIDAISLVISNENLQNCNIADIIDEIRESVQPDSISIKENIALIATVGPGIPQRSNIGARMFGALSKHNVNTQLIDMGASELNVIIGVDESDFETAIRTIYEEFCGNEEIKNNE